MFKQSVNIYSVVFLFSTRFQSFSQNIKYSVLQIVTSSINAFNIPIFLSKAGKLTFEIKALPNNGSDRSSFKKTESAIEILPKPFRIISFTLNASEQPNQELKEGATAILSWRVEGEDIQVKLDPIIGDVPPVGSRELPVNQAFPSQIKLQVNDKLGKQQPQEKAFAIAVIKKVEPTVAPPPILPAPQTTPDGSKYKSPVSDR
jgi:hypothetical protein